MWTLTEPNTLKTSYFYHGPWLVISLKPNKPGLRQTECSGNDVWKTGETGESWILLRKDSLHNWAYLFPEGDSFRGAQIQTWEGTQFGREHFRWSWYLYFLPTTFILEKKKWPGLERKKYLYVTSSLHMTASRLIQATTAKFISEALQVCITLIYPSFIIFFICTRTPRKRRQII